MPRGDRPFQVLECINDNAYKIDLPDEYSVSATFNVVDLSPFNFDIGADLRMNHCEKGGMMQPRYQASQSNQVILCIIRDQ